MILQLLGVCGLAALNGLAPLNNDIVNDNPLNVTEDGLITNTTITINNFNQIYTGGNLVTSSSYCHFGIGLVSVGDSLYSNTLFNIPANGFNRAQYCSFVDNLMNGSYLQGEGYDTGVQKFNYAIYIEGRYGYVNSQYRLSSVRYSFIFGEYLKNKVVEIRSYSDTFGNDFELVDMNVYLQDDGFPLYETNNIDYLRNSLNNHPMVCKGDDYYLSYSSSTGDVLENHVSVYPYNFYISSYNSVTASTSSLFLGQLGFSFNFSDTLYNFDNSDERIRQEAYEEGFQDGEANGHYIGYAEGIEYAHQQNSTALTIFEGIINVALLPINFFLACLNFEVFGINIGGAVSALLTVAIVFILCRTIFSGGNGSKE